MVSLFPDFKEFLKLLNSNGVKYLLLGGYAVNYYGYNRTTGDLDVWIAVDPENAAKLSAALQQFAFSADAVPPALFLEHGKMFRFGRKPVMIEILTNPSGVDFVACYVNRVTATLDGVEVSLISLEDLKTNKLASARPKDIDDLQHLR